MSDDTCALPNPSSFNGFFLILKESFFFFKSEHVSLLKFSASHLLWVLRYVVPNKIWSSRHGFVLLELSVVLSVVKLNVNRSVSFVLCIFLLKRPIIALQCYSFRRVQSQPTCSVPQGWLGLHASWEYFGFPGQLRCFILISSFQALVSD